MTEAENAAAMMRLDVKGEFEAMQIAIEELRAEVVQLKDEGGSLYVGQMLYVEPANATDWSYMWPGPWRVEALGHDWVVYRYRNDTPEIAGLK